MGDPFAEAFPTFFLPIEVPNRPLLESHGRDENWSVLQCLAAFLPSDRCDATSFPQLQGVAQLFIDLHRGGMDPGAIKACLQATPISDYCGLWIREQNAALLIKRLDSESALVLVWELQCPNRYVTGNTLSVQQALPRSGMKVPWERLLKSGHTEFLSDLVRHAQDRALPKSSKAGQEFHESRDVNDPRYALDLLLCALGGEVLVPGDSGLLATSTLTKKKMRDEVRYQSSKNPWRRAPIWSALKSILHIVNFREQGNDKLYKLFISGFLAFVLEKVVSRFKALSPNETTISLSSLQEASMKLTRRLAKMQTNQGSDDMLASKVACSASATDRIVQMAMAVIKQASEVEYATFQPVSDQKPSLQNLVSDTVHTMPKSREVLQILVHAAKTNGDISSGSSQEQYGLGMPASFLRLRQWSALTASDVSKQAECLRSSLHKKFSTSPQDFIGTLHDVSEGVMDAFQSMKENNTLIQPDPDILSIALQDLQCAVIETCLNDEKQEIVPFEKDVRGRSQAILACLTICMMIDQIACAKYPLLREHRVGGGSSLSLDTLFLTSVRQKKHLHEVEKYLQERERAKARPTLEDHTSAASFSVRYAEQSPEMQDALRQILQKCTENQRAKRLETSKKQQRYKDLMSSVNNTGCTCKRVYSHYHSHDIWVKCHRCDEENIAKNIKVQYYDKLLPPERHHQLAVVYDLMQPPVLACQRDCLVDFARLVCNEEWTEDAPWTALWRDELALLNWRTAKTSAEVQLGSTRKKITQSHYETGYVKDVKEFVVENDYNTTPMASSGKPIVGIDGWTWNILVHTEMTLWPGRYANLARFYNSFSHCENEVSALQSEASEQLSLREFETVGLLRAGHKLQLVRLANGIAQRGLSLDREEIVSLICCALWQVGPGCEGSWLRENFGLLSSTPGYILDVCKHLAEVLDGCRLNWGNQNVLMNVLHIARTLFAHSCELGQEEGLINACADVMRSCREVAFDWIRSLTLTANGCTDDSKMQILQNKMADVAAMGTNSFFDHAMLLSTSEDFGYWNYFRAVFQDNHSPNQMIEVSWRRPYLLHAMSIAEELSPRLRVLKKKTRSDGLDNFLQLYWTSGASSGAFEQSWRCYQDDCCPGWYHAQFRLDAKVGGNLCILEFDTIGGTFLVNGSPCSRLPKAIVAHRVYRRLFGDAMFVVQPLGSGGYRTAMSVHGFHYEFYPASFNASLGLGDAPIIIKESVEARAVLIPDSLLTDDVPKLLSSSHSHWFILTSSLSSKLYFRALTYTDLRLQDPFEDDEYILDCSTWKLHEKRSNANMLDVHSKSFEHFHKNVFHRLSPAPYVHILVPGDGRKTGDLKPLATIQLPRLQNIRFDYDGRVIVSSEFDLQVAADQGIGTLIGLQHGLLLEDPSQATNKLFICPHGEVSRCESSISIDIENLASPPLFKYEVRPELQILCGKSKLRLEWLFLVLLHAQTGSLQLDPFISCTGTERALHMLRSAHCSGTLLTSVNADELAEEFEPEIQLLVKIAAISPSRRDYHAMEMSTVPDGRPALCAHPALAFMVKLRLKQIAVTLKRIGRESVVPDSLSRSDNEVIATRTCPLGVRAYFLRRENYSKDTCLTPEEEEAVFGVASAIECKHYDPPPGFGSTSMNAARFLGFISQGGVVEINKRALLLDLLCNRPKLLGISQSLKLSGFSSVCFARIHTDMSKEDPDFADAWMNLYRLAQTQDDDNTEQFDRYCNLLVWFGVEYPAHLNHIYQLMLVAKYPTQFPSSPEHTQYKLTHEHEYVPKHAESAIEDNLEGFSTVEPIIGYHSTKEARHRHRADHKLWKENKLRHESATDATKLHLKNHIRDLFRRGESVRHADVCEKKVSSPSYLQQKLTSLFKRWRKARELREFLISVTNALDVMQRTWVVESLDTAPPPLCRVYSPSVHRPRVDFRMDTCRAPPGAVSDTNAEELRHMANTGKLPEKYRLEWDVTSLSQLPLATETLKLIFDDTLVHKHPEYTNLHNEITTELKKSWKLANVHENDSFAQFSDTKKVADLQKQLTLYWNKADGLMNDIWKLIERELSDPSDRKHLVGLWNATTPSKVLAAFFQGAEHSDAFRCGNKEISFSDLLFAYAVSVKNVQRARRCLRLLQKGSAAFPRLARDLRNDGCDGWKPKEYPEFLGFEVDNDICIRPLQAEVAVKIMREDLGNRLLQLNMGEGKTAVIMPLVLCAAARGSKIVRATVLPSLFSTNATDWQHKLGGLLGRRIYTLGCRRDLSLGKEQALLMLETLDTIQNEKHIIVTTPEHRLSLENKAIELCSKKSQHSNTDVGRSLLQVMGKLAQYGREFLDESDEILSPMYQLIYTLGAPKDMDGHMLRWVINAAVLQSVQQNARALQERFGTETVELNVQNCEGNEHLWLRLLESDHTAAAYDFLCEIIEKDIRTGIVPRAGGLGLKMLPKDQAIWSACVRGNEESLNKLESLSERVRQSALLLRGLLSHEVLKLMLQKRFRVDYGLHPTRKGYQLAVPYRAKDVAAERTEFGHPDVALGLTFASYYQSGLGEFELRQVFQRLSQSQMSGAAAKAIYGEWVQDITDDDGIAEYEGLNLQDPVLFADRLFPAFHRNVGCIDFYLCKLILPVQAKQFPHKILSTAGDLCRNKDLGASWEAVTTGFSGTEDLSPVLPPTVHQNNLVELAKTNGVQLRAILRQQNNHYHALTREAASPSSTDQLLLLLHERDMRSNVVLDSGALVLHMDNAEFASSWLKFRPEMEACVFFIGDKVFYVTHSSVGRPQSFLGSPYADDMSSCLLYLDDEHTRGSDFALPLETRAIVTLGKGMTKDKFVQTCMRMRQLQSSQSLTFVAAPEVDQQLRRYHLTGTLQNTFIPHSILNWTIWNTTRRICDLFPYLIGQTVSTIKKASALQTHNFSSDDLTQEEANDLADTCVEDETLPLQGMYGHHRGTFPLPEIADHQLKSLPSTSSEGIVTDLRSRISKLVPLVRRQGSLLDEEQERELENELEEERQIERPPPARHIPNKVSPELVKLLSLQTVTIQDDAFFVNKLGFRPLCDIFKETSMCEDFRDQLNGANVYCTEDFTLTVQGSGEKDPHVKRIQWLFLLPLQNHKKAAAVVISNFEAEALSHLVGGNDTSNPLQSLFSFAALQRRGQDAVVLRNISAAGVPACVHVIGGSLYAEGLLLNEIQEFLALCPSPQDDTVVLERWEQLFNECHIERDGFVPPGSRAIVRPSLCQSPFTRSPVGLLLRFLSNVRHAGEELPNSPVGRMLGASDIEVEKCCSKSRP